MYEGKNGAGNVKTVFLFSLAFAFMLLSVSQVYAACPTGMVSYWKGENNANDEKLLYPGSTPNGMSYSTEGKVGSAFDMDGNSNYVFTSLMPPTVIPSQCGYSIEAWAYPTDLTGDRFVFGSEGSGRFGLYTRNTGWAMKHGGGDIFNMKTAILNQWQHVALTVDSSCQVIMYLNGVPSSTYSVGGSLAPYNAYIGAQDGYNNPGQFFSGKLDEVAFYNRALTQAEVTEHYNNGLQSKDYCGNAAALPEPTACPTGMVSYWKGEDNANDVKGLNPGTAQGGLTYTAGRVGQAFTFNGADASVFMGNPDSLKFANAPMTIEFWVNPINYDDKPLVTKASYSAPGNGVWNGYGVLMNYAGNAPLGIQMTAYKAPVSGQVYGTEFHTATNTISQNNWNHVVSIWKSNGNIDIYINGQKMSGTQNPPFAGPIVTNYNFYLGKWDDSNYPRYFQGKLDEVAIYDRELTQAEITDHYNNGAGKDYCTAAAPPEPAPTCGQGDTAGMVSYWKGEGNTSDSSGNSINGQALGGLTYDQNGKVGKAFKFDGTSSSVSVPDNSAFDFGSNSFTITYWEKRQSGSHATMSRDGTTIMTPWLLGYDDGSHNLQALMSTGAAAWDICITPMGTAVFDDWAFYTITRDGSNIYIYQNGILKGTCTTGTALPDNPNPLSFGKAQGEYYFNGSLDEIAMYNRALSLSEIQSLYNKTKDGVAGYCGNAAAPPEPTCTAGDTQPCYTGPDGTEGVGSCAAGAQECAADGMSWGACTGETLPQIEECNNADDDCDGTVDNVLAGNSLPCTKTAGVCQGAMQTCSGGYWTDCEISDYQAHSSFYRVAENTVDTCWDGMDNDCNGLFDSTELKCQPGGAPLPPCTVDQMMDMNNDGTIDSFDALLMLRTMIMYPNNVAGNKNCQAVILSA